MKLKDFDFRVWNEGSKKYLPCPMYATYQYEVDKGLPKDLRLMSEGLEIELYSGYNDSAGKKIYAGDLVIMLWKTYEVVCSSAPLEFYFKNQNNEIIPFNKILPKSTFMLVVGNIHEGITESQSEVQ